MSHFFSQFHLLTLQASIVYDNCNHILRRQLFLLVLLTCQRWLRVWIRTIFYWAHFFLLFSLYLEITFSENIAFSMISTLVHKTLFTVIKRKSIRRKNWHQKGHMQSWENSCLWMKNFCTIADLIYHYFHLLIPLPPTRLSETYN